MTQTIVLIIGASISGLACAATLQKHGISYIIIEKEAQTVMPWRNHYKRLWFRHRLLKRTVRYN